MTGPAVNAGHVKAAFGQVPLYFEANAEQTDERVQFLARGPGYALFLTPDEAVLSLQPPVAERQSRTSDSPRAANLTQHSALSTQHSVIRMQLVRADAAAVQGQDELPGKANYFIGNDPARWRTDVPTYARVQYREVYPGIDLIYYGNQGQLEYDFVVAPGADPNQVRLRFEGAESLAVDAAGDLVARVGDAEVRQRKPVVYQEMAGGRHEVAGDYRLVDDGEVQFALASYHADRPLVIDPVLVYSTYLGGTIADGGHGITVDSQGNALVTGYALSTNFPIMNALQNSNAGQADVFVTKLGPTGTLLYSTYIGGTGDDRGHAITVDSLGNAYVTGQASAGFPSSNGHAGQQDAFVTATSHHPAARTV